MKKYNIYNRELNYGINQKENKELLNRIYKAN